MAHFFIVQRGPEIGKRYNLEGKEITIGRSDDNDISFDDPYISRYHAVLKEKDGKLLIIDLGSENPVQIRDTPLEPGNPYSFENRDIVRFGQNILIYVDSSQLPAKPSSTALSAGASPKMNRGESPASNQESSSLNFPQADALAPGSFAPATQANQNPETSGPTPSPVPPTSVETGSPKTGNAMDSMKESSNQPQEEYGGEATVFSFQPPAWKAGGYSSPESEMAQPAGYNSPAWSPPLEPEKAPGGAASVQSGNYNPGSGNFGSGAPVEEDKDTSERTVVGGPAALNTPPPYGDYNQGQAYDPNQAYGQYNQGQQYNQNQDYNQAQQFGQGYAGYNQPGQAQYNQPQYGQVPGQNEQPPQYGQPYGQYGQYGQPGYGQYGQPPADPNHDATQIASYDQYKPGHAQPGEENPTKPVIQEPEFDAGDAPTTVIRVDKTKK